MQRYVMRLCVLLLACGLWSEARSQFFYSYEGQPFTDVSGPYTTSNRLTGQLELLEVLPPFLISEDISGLLQGFSFEDGQQVRTPFNSGNCGLRVTTDGTGAIRGWGILLREAPLPSAGSPQFALDSVGPGPFSVDQGGTLEAGSELCASAALVEAGFNFGQPGQWTPSVPLPADPRTYVYSGQAFTTVESPNVSGDGISGLFTVNGPIPAQFGPDNISVLVDSFSFSDGQDSFDNVNGVICDFDFQIGTDLYGRFTDWQITIALDADAEAFIDTQRILTIASSGGDVVTTDTVGLAPCDLASPPSGTESSTPDNGTWDSATGTELEVTRYAYTGQCYDQASGGGEVGDRTTGWVDFEGALPADLQPQALDEYVVDFNFRDDLQTRTFADSALCVFQIGTNGDGEIDSWSMLLRESPLPVLSDPQGSMRVDSLGINVSSIIEAPASICDGGSAIDVQSVGQEGHWVLTNILFADEFETRRCSSSLTLQPSRYQD